MTQSFNCTSCGAPNEPEAGAIRMACSYCGTNLTIPETLRTKAQSKVERIPSKTKPVSVMEIDAPDLLRKAQPVVVKAWNMYAYWTWLRWIIPTCLTILVIGFFACAALGALPFVFRFFR